MASLKAYPTVGELVAEMPGRAAAFEKLGIDYCCGGKRSLDEACEEKGLDPVRVLLELLNSDAQAATRSGERDWRAAPLAELCNHIVDVHHGFLRTALPRISQLARKVSLVHGEHHPELLPLRDVFELFRAHLEEHMKEEEERLFPECMAGRGSPASIHEREQEHEEAGQALSQMRKLSNDYSPPPEACGSYRALFAALAELESDMHRHVHKENNILFPRALARPNAAGA